MNNAFFTKAINIRIDENYVTWLNDLKQRYQSAQIKSAIKINDEKLRFNWSLASDIVTLKAEESWGAGVVEQLSFDLQEAFPNDKGFGTRNLWRMKQWYIFFSTQEALNKLTQLGAELKEHTNLISQKVPQAGSVFDNSADFPFVLSLLPWRHQTEIVSKCKDIDEAIFYIKQTIIGGWSRETLNNAIKSELYNTQGKAITNFPTVLPQAQSLIAQEITKDNYNFGFISVPVDYKEEELESALEHNITRFLLELGTGFAFVGRQKELIIEGRSRRINMLFYHIKLKAYVVVELKTKPFNPEYAGKLNFYVNAVDELLKGNDDNPTIGLLICSDKNETEVKWAFKGIETPIGVASYDNVQVLLPSTEELQVRIKLAESEFNKKTLK